MKTLTGTYTRKNNQKHRGCKLNCVSKEKK